MIILSVMSFGVYSMIKQDIVHKIMTNFFQPLQPAECSIYQMGLSLISVPVCPVEAAVGHQFVLSMWDLGFRHEKQYASPCL